MAAVPVHEPATTSSGGTTEEAPRPGPALFRRRVVWLSALVAVATVVAQYVIMPPPLYFDPYYVWEAARRWPDVPLDQWPFNEVPHQVTRLGLVLPARVIQDLLGPGQVAYFTIAALGGCVFFVGCYLAVRSLFGDVAGVASVLVLLVHPFFTGTNPYGHELTWSLGVMLPDMPGAGLFAAGMAALVVASRRAGSAQTRLLLAAGVCFGSAFLVREFLALLFPAIPIFLYLLRVTWRRNVVIALPMIGILIASLIHNAIVWGGPLAGLVSAATHGGKSYDVVTRMLALNSFGRAMSDWSPLGWLFIAALALNIVGWAITRDRRLALTLTWFLTLAVPLTLRAGVIDPDEISIRAWLPRYWFAVLPALLAGGFGSLILLWRALPARWATHRRPRALMAALVAVIVSVYVVQAVREVPELPRDKAWGELRGWLKGRDDIPTIWADRRLAQTMTFYTRSLWGTPQWHGDIEDFPHTAGTLPSGAYQAPMLYTRWRGQESQIAGGARPSQETGWQLLWRSSDGVLELWDYQAPPA
ncbi:ArnT family glycosyltransferase [Actinomadura sp. 6N118]|uniref:ArnT family glycosyltransferase n=1 Tax=Actinomadura sp. 6N118 TaxID=3375151 RepID=UPI0037AAFA7C